MLGFLLSTQPIEAVIALKSNALGLEMHNVTNFHSLIDDMW
jgi:hypothetical protein